MLNQQIKFRLKKCEPFTNTKGGTRAGSRSYPKKIIRWENFEVEAADDNMNDNVFVDNKPIASCSTTAWEMTSGRGLMNKGAPPRVS